MPATRKLQRKTAHRQWLLRNLTTSVILYERITTTEARAKETRRLVDQVINWGKSGRLSDWRRLRAYLPDVRAAKKIREVLVARFADRPSGYTRLIRLGMRPGDGAMSYLIELLPGKDLTSETNEPTEKQAKTEIVETKPERKGINRLRQPKADVTIRRRIKKEAAS